MTEISIKPGIKINRSIINPAGLMMSMLPSVLLLALLLFTCNSSLPPDVIAVIDGQVIKITDFYGYISKPAFDRMNADDKKQVLNEYIDKRLIEKAIADSDYFSDPGIQQEVEFWSRSFMSDMLFKRDVIGSVITEEKLAELFEDLGTQRSISLIIIKYSDDIHNATSNGSHTKSAALKLIEEIRRRADTEDFTQLAESYSDLQRISGSMGSPGWVIRYTQEQPLEEIIWTTDVGQISTPFIVNDSYCIVKVNEERPVPMKPYSAEKPYLFTLAMKLWADEITDRYSQITANLRHDASFIIDHTQLNEFISNYNGIQAQNLDLPPAKDLFHKTLEIISPDLILGQYSGTKIDKAWVQKYFNWYTDEIRDFSQAEILEYSLTVVASMDLFYTKAVSEDFESDPVYRMELDACRKKLAFERYVDMNLRVKDEFSDKQLKEFYEQNRDRYLSEEQYRIQDIRVADSKVAETVYQLAIAGADFSQLAQEHSQAWNGTRAEGAILIISGSNRPELSATIAKMDIGDVTPIIQHGETYLICKLLEVLPPVPLFYSEVKERIRQDYMTSEENRLRADHIDMLMDQYGVRINTSLGI